MALATVLQISQLGTTNVYNVPLATEQIISNDDQFLHVKNANAGACVVTFTDPGLTPGGSAATNPTVSVPATTGDKMIALNVNWANPATGLIQATFSVQTSVSVALFRM